MLLLVHFFGYFILFSRVLQLSSSHSCHKELKLNWTVTISDSPVVSSPLLVPSKNGGSHQLIVATHDGSVSIVNTASGEEDSQWPVHFPEKTFFAGPLLYDIDQDGAMDILLTGSDGEILFLSRNGTLMSPYSIVLPYLLVRRKWNILSKEVIQDRTKQPDLEPSSNTQFISAKEYRDGLTSLAKRFVLVDTHVLSTPVIGDFNGDGINSELIIPMNFYFDEDIKNDLERLNNLTLEASEIDFYLANGIIVIDLRTREVIFNVTFELDMKSSDFPAYLLSSPIVVDLDGNYGDPEVIIGSSSGKIHVWNRAGKYSQSFELSDSLNGEIAVGDTNNDGKLEIVVVDASANVICYDNKKVIWEATVSGTMTAGAQFQDINQDGRTEVVIATNDGYVWVLDGQSGKVLPNWPLKLGDEIYSKVLFYKNSDKLVEMIVMSKGNMNIIGGGSHCMEVIPTDEISYVPVIFDPIHEAFIVSTTDGAVMSFQQQDQNATIFPIKQTGITFTKATKDLHVVTAGGFSVEYEIFDNQDETHKWKSYTVILSFSTEKGVVHHVSSYDKPGVYVVSLRAPQAPKKSYVLVELCNQFKECSEDIIHIQFHPETRDHLILYMILPFLVMVSLLLVLHGYPEGNLLPTWGSSKKQ